VSTGPGGDQWREQLESIERAWLKLDATAGLGAELSPWACYRGGCSIDVTFATPEAQESFSRLITGSSALSLWKGPGFHSGPVRLDSGEVRVTWVFYAPPVGV
jgi:hypothetical protein